jgi:predicted MFS family arabinose efflux permease
MWGACFGAIPSGWSMWVAQAAPKQAETAGGLYVAAVQLSAAVGAMAGGAFFDRWGAQAVLLFSAVLWLASAGTVLLRLRQRPL